MNIKKYIAFIISLMIIFSALPVFSASENLVKDNFDSYASSATEGGWGGSGKLYEYNGNKSVIIGNGNGDILNKSISGFSEDVTGLIAKFSIKFEGATNKEVIFGAGTNNGVAATSRMLQFSSSGKMQALATADFNIPISYTTGIWYDIDLKVNYNTGYYEVSVYDGVETKRHSFKDDKFKRNSTDKANIKYYSFWISDANSAEAVYIDNVNIFGTTDNRIYPVTEEKINFADLTASEGTFSKTLDKEIVPATVKIPVKGEAEFDVVLEDSKGNSDTYSFSGADTDVYITVKDGKLTVFASNLFESKDSALCDVKKVKLVSDSLSAEKVEYILVKSSTFFELVSSTAEKEVLPDKNEIILTFSSEMPKKDNGTFTISGDRTIETVTYDGKNVILSLDGKLSSETDYVLSYSDVCDFGGSTCSGEITFKTAAALKSEDFSIVEDEGNYKLSVKLKSNTGEAQSGVIILGVYDKDSGKLLSKKVQTISIPTDGDTFTALAEGKENSVAEGYVLDSLFGKVATGENTIIEKCEIDDGNVTISGKSESKKIKLYIFESGNDLSAFEKTEKELDFFREITTDEEGNFTIDIPMSGGKKGNKDIVIRADGKSEHYKKAFYLISNSDRDTFVEKLNGDNFGEDLLLNLDIIDEEASIYAVDENIRETVVKEIEEVKKFKYKKFENCDQIKKAFNFALMTVLMQNGDAGKVLDEYKDKTFLAEENFMTYYGSEGEKLVAKLEEDVPENAEKLYRFIGEELILLAIKNASTYVKVADVLIENEEFLGIDLNGYKKLKDKSSVNKKLMKNCESIDMLSDNIKKYVKEESKKTESSGGGSSSSGGTSFGGGVSANDGGYTSGVFAEEVKDRNYFSDLGGAEWAKDSINALADMGIVSGVGGGKYEPSRPVTREEFVKMIVCAFLGNVSNGNKTFDDVNENDWCYPYVSQAYESGYIKGVSGNSFGKGKSISREEAALILLRIYGKSLKGIYKFSDDAEISDYAKDGVNTMAQLGIMKGDENHNFMPKKSLTRAECAKIIYGLYTEMEEK